MLASELDKLVDRRVGDLEADARKTNPIKLIANSVPAPEVTEAEIQARYDATRNAKSPAYEMVRSQLRESILEEKTHDALMEFFGTLRTKYAATARVAPLRIPVEPVGPRRGASAPSVTIVEFGDFQCPFCRQMEPTLGHVVSRYAGKVALVFRNYPLTDIHPQALHAAESAVCADHQGKYWEMHDAIYTDAKPLGVDSLREIAKLIGLDMAAFEQCVRDAATDKAILADVRAGDEAAVHATPALFVNGRYLQGAQTEQQLAAVIDEELASPHPSTVAAANLAR